MTCRWYRVVGCQVRLVASSASSESLMSGVSFVSRLSIVGDDDLIDSAVVLVGLSY